jgi:hypothetical protein
VFNGRAENKKDRRWNAIHERQWKRNGNVDGCGVHLPMREERDGALVVSVAGVGVEQLVQRGGDRHRVEQENQSSQCQSNGRLTPTLAMWREKPHNKTRLAGVIIDARKIEAGAREIISARHDRIRLRVTRS